MTTPTALGLGKDSWRPGQWETIQRVLRSDKRVVFLDAPTGTGKSLIAAAVAALCGRALIVTKTHQLQEQYLADFPALVEIKGHANYCDEPDDCDMLQNPCSYQAARAEAADTDTVVTNYDYLAAAWPSRHGKTSPLHNRSILIGDEAHLADDSLRSATAVNISARVADQEQAPHTFDLAVWSAWGQKLKHKYQSAAATLARMLERANRDATIQGGQMRDYLNMREVRRLRSEKKLSALGDSVSYLIDNDLVRVRLDRGGASVEPVFAQQAFRLLLDGQNTFSKIVLMSATLPGPTVTAQLLGLDPDEYELITLPSTFPVESRPFAYMPVVKVSKKMPPGEMYDLVSRLDELLDHWSDRKGIIHCNAYWLRDYIVQQSSHAGQMITHGARGLPLAVEEFRAAGPGTWLLSPTAHSGVDLPGDHVRGNIILKLPSPDLGDPIVATRKEVIPDTYPLAQAAQLVQAYGRGMRSVDDWCETVILDANFGWWRKSFARLLPPWFKEAITDI